MSVSFGTADETMSATDVILIGVVAGVTGLLDAVGAVSLPVGFGISGFYVGVAFYTAFAVWFGWRGLIGIYVGLLVGNTIIGQLTVTAPLTNLGNVVGALFPLLIFGWLGFDPMLRSVRDYAAMAAAAVLYSVFSGIAYFGVAYLLGLVPREALVPGLTVWIVGDTLIILTLGTVLLRTLTPVVARMSYTSMQTQ